MPEKVIRGRWAVSFLLGLIIVLCLPATVVAAECEFLGRFKTLHDLIPDEVGECTENASPIENGIFQRTTSGILYIENGSVQRTTNGILTWNEADDTVRFTNGLHTWVNGANGLESISHDEIAQLRGFMARALMKEAVEDYIIEHGMWGFLGLGSVNDIRRSVLRVSSGPAIRRHRHYDDRVDLLGPSTAIVNYFNWQDGWKRLNPNQEGVHQHTPTWLIEWLDLPYSEQWQIHQVLAEQMLLLQEVWLRRYHPLIVAAYADVYSNGAEYIQEKKEEGCFPTTPVIDLPAREGCRDSRKHHDYVRLVAMWYVLHDYTDLE